MAESVLMTPQEFAEYAIQHVSIGTVYKKTVTINNKLVRRNGVLKEIMELKSLMRKSGNSDLLLMDGEELSQYAEAFNESFCTIVARRQSKQARDQVKSGSEFGDGLDYTLLYPVIDVQTGTKVLMNPKTTTVSSINYEVWEQCLPKEIKSELLATNRIHAVLRYDPYNLAPHQLEPFEDIGMVLKINTYIPPTWRKEEPETDECPELVDRLLKHLFPDKDCREFVISWMHHALVHRNETYLVLNSAKGVGKGVFASCLKALVGMEHYTEAHRGFLDSQFNSLLANRRMVVLDELSVNTPEKVNKLKSYINRYQNLEAKHKNATDTRELFTSFMISNNSISDLHIESDDRRFSVVDITEKPLTASMTMEEIEELYHCLEGDLDYQRQLGYWILNHGMNRKYDNFFCWKGPKYEKIVYSSLPEWARHITEMLEDCEEGMTLAHKDLQRSFAKEQPQMRMAGKDKVGDFLKNYRVGGETIGYVSKEDGFWVIVSNMDNTLGAL